MGDEMLNQIGMVMIVVLIGILIVRRLIAIIIEAIDNAVTYDDFSLLSLVIWFVCFVVGVFLVII